MTVYSFLLVNFNMSGLLERCVASIEAQLDANADYEILIADNSTDERFRVADEFEERHAKARVSRLKENRGFVHALNRLIAVARGRYVVIMHPDVELNLNCLDELSAFLGRHPCAGVASPNLRNPDDTADEVRLRFPSVRQELRRLGNMLAHIVLRRRPFDGEPMWDRAADVRVDMVMSVMMMFRREALLAACPVDGRLWTYYANDWLCARLGQRGWSCHYIAAARAIHWERYADRRLYSDSETSSYKRSTVPVSDRMYADRFTFLRQFYSRPRVWVFRALVTLEFLVHILAQLKPGRRRRSEAIRRFGATIRVAWT